MSLKSRLAALERNAPLAEDKKLLAVYWLPLKDANPDDGLRNGPSLGDTIIEGRTWRTIIRIYDPKGAP